MKLAKNFTPEAIDHAVERAKELGLIDDGELAQLLAEQMLEQRHYAPARITAELQKRGISRTQAEETAAALAFDPAQEITLLLETKFKNDVGDGKGLRRVFAALVRMGYAYGDVKTALESVSDTEEFYDA